MTPVSYFQRARHVFGDRTVQFASVHTTDIVMDPGDSVPIYEGDTLRLDILVWLAVIRQSIL